MIIRNAVSVLLAFAACSAHASGTETAYELQAIGTIEVAPDGSVHAYTLESDLDGDVATVIDRTVRTWRFEPVLVDGRPVIAKTRMHLELEAEPVEDGYLLRVSDVYFGGAAARDNQPPRYPSSALHAGVTAEVILVLKLDAAGKVDQMHVEQVSLSENAGSSAKRLEAHFIAASRRAAAGWTYNMAELVDGKPVPASVRVPVHFSLGETDGWTERMALVPGPVHPLPWEDEDGDEAAAEERRSGLASGDIQTLDSRVRLKDEVVGSVL